MKRSIQVRKHLTRLRHLSVALAMLVFGAGSLHSQVVDNLPPSFPGGQQALENFIADHFKVPEIARKAGIQGRITVEFTVKTDGSLNDVRVSRGIGAGCDEEAVRVVKRMPKWIPGTVRGIPTSLKHSLEIGCNLSEGRKSHLPQDHIRYLSK